MDVEARTLGKVTRRLVPFLIICYFFAYLDRINVSFASLTMNKELGLSAAAYGFGAGLFYLIYSLFEVPSNLALERFGARRWITRIMFTWGLISGAFAFIPQISRATGLSPEYTFYLLRALLGVAEAGFFPGIIFFLTLWFPTARRARVTGLFMSAMPLSGLIGAPLSSQLMQLHGFGGLSGWQWLFLLEAVPTILLSFAVAFYLTDYPSIATWLTSEEKWWLRGRLQQEAALRLQYAKPSVLQAILNPKTLLLGFIYFGSVAARDAISFFLPQTVKDFGLTVAETGFVSAVPYLIATLGMVGWGALSDARAERKAHVAIPMALAAAGLVACTLVTDPYAKMAALCLASFGAFACVAPFWTLPTAYLTGAAAAGGIAAVNTIAQVGGFYGPSLVGWVKDATGSVNLGYYAIAALTLCGALTVLLLRHDENRASGQVQVEEELASTTPAE